MEMNSNKIHFQRIEVVAFVHSTQKENLANLVRVLQRALGNNNVIAIKPFYNPRRQSWTMQVLIKNVPTAFKFLGMGEGDQQ
jgi:hypothetical protein